MDTKLITPKFIEILQNCEVENHEHFGKMEPDKFTLDERKAITEYLREKTDLRQIDVADLLHVDRRTIINYEKETHEISMRILGPVNTTKAAKELRIVAHKCMEKAWASGSYRAFWKIKRELTEALGRMGFITWHSGDIVMGDKNEMNVTSIHGNVLTENLNALSSEEREKMREQFVAAGLLKKREGTDGK